MPQSHHTSPTLDELQLVILRKMKDATSRGALKWQIDPSDPDLFLASNGDFSTFIRFKWPAYNGDADSDRDVVVVDGAGTFMVGTPGWMLALEILAAGLDNWDDHTKALRRQFSDQIVLLENLTHDR